MSCTAHLLTSRTPGAVAVIQLVGECDRVIRALTGKSLPRPGRVALRDLAGIDSAVVTRVSDDSLLVMPHGGPRLITRILEALAQHGCPPIDTVPPPAVLYPEAEDEFEALMLAALAEAQSSAAIELLLRQPRLWRNWDRQKHPLHMLRERAVILQRLIHPPLVALVGPVNAGKSTLTNALAGRDTSLTSPLPGTTRDYVGVTLDLQGLTVNWIDTPGIGSTHDSLDEQAKELLRLTLPRADLVIWAAPPDASFPPDEQELAAAGIDHVDLLVISKCDLADPAEVEKICRSSPVPCLGCSALTGEGSAALCHAVAEKLVPASVRRADSPWLFDERLVAAAEGGT